VSIVRGFFLTQVCEGKKLKVESYKLIIKNYKKFQLVILGFSNQIYVKIKNLKNDNALK
jgi:hypothetical protein